MVQGLRPEGFQRTFISPAGAEGTVREGGLTQTGAGGDNTSYQRGPSYRQSEVADPRKQVQDNSKMLMYVGAALAVAWFIARS